MKSNPTDLRADAARNYRRLLQAADAIFTAQGPLAPIEDISKRAGLGIGTLYRHFPSRKDLLAAVYDERLDELEANARSLMQTATPDKAFGAWLDLATRYASQYRGFGYLLGLLAEDRASSVVTAGSELLRRAQCDGTLRPDVSMHDILQLINGIIAPGTTPEELQHNQKLLSVIISGLKDRSAESNA